MSDEWTARGASLEDAAERLQDAALQDGASAYCLEDGAWRLQDAAIGRDNLQQHKQLNLTTFRWGTTHPSGEDKAKG